MYLLNPEQGDKITYELKFTFHYVSIKSLDCSNWCRCDHRFTFHYVSIKSSVEQLEVKDDINLHSTMYLLNQGG